MRLTSIAVRDGRVPPLLLTGPAADLSQVRSRVAVDQNCPGGETAADADRASRACGSVNGAVVDSIDGHRFHSVAQDKTPF
jgi:hypothetical protein